MIFVSSTTTSASMICHKTFIHPSQQAAQPTLSPLRREPHSATRDRRGSNKNQEEEGNRQIHAVLAISLAKCYSGKNISNQQKGEGHFRTSLKKLCRLEAPIRFHLHLERALRQGKHPVELLSGVETKDMLWPTSQASCEVPYDPGVYCAYQAPACFDCLCHF